MEVSRDEFIDIVAYALWRHRRLRPGRQSREDHRLWARLVVEHLERSGIAWSRRPSSLPHGTP